MPGNSLFGFIGFSLLSGTEMSLREGSGKVLNFPFKPSPNYFGCIFDKAKILMRTMKESFRFGNSLLSIPRSLFETLEE